MSSGRFNVRAAFHQLTESRDGADVDVTFAKQFSRWVGLSKHTGREYELASQSHDGLSEIVTVPYDTTVGAVTPRWRVAIGSRTLEIISAFNDMERNRVMVFLCRETDGN